MKSMIHELQKSKLLSVSKKVMMLAIVVLGTSAMVNAQTDPVKTAPAKEVKMGKHKKEKPVAAKTETKKPVAAKTETKKVEVKKTETKKAESTK